MYFVYLVGVFICVLQQVYGQIGDKMIQIGENEIESDGRIVGGEDADPAEFPYQVSIRKNGHMCGGSIINMKYILTAAHCLQNKNSWDLTVITGTNLLSGIGGTVYYVEKLIVHPQYSKYNMENDIGLIKLHQNIKFNTNVQPIPMWGSELEDGEELILSGWGSVRFPGGLLPYNLQRIKLISYNNEKCRVSHATRMPITKTQICTLTEKGEGACHGDSGGPLAYNGKQVGVVSWGYPCAKGYPDVFTKVSSYVDWINNNMDMK